VREGSSLSGGPKGSWWFFEVRVGLAIVMGRLWNICYCIVVQLKGSGILFLLLSVFIGCCQDGWWTYYLGGITGLVSIILTFGI
jgi:hypothetical protein